MIINSFSLLFLNLFPLRYLFFTMSYNCVRNLDVILKAYGIVVLPGFYKITVNVAIFINYEVTFQIDLSVHNNWMLVAPTIIGNNVTPFVFIAIGKAWSVIFNSIRSFFNCLICFCFDLSFFCILLDKGIDKF